MLKKLSTVISFFSEKAAKNNKNTTNMYTKQHDMWYYVRGDSRPMKGCEKRMVSVQALCNTIIKKSFDENIPVSPMKLQKLLYFIYRDYLKETNSVLFAEDFQAWKYGPVLESVYDEFKTFRSNRITRFAKTANGEVYVINETLEPILCSVINSVWNKYKGYDGIALSQVTHEEGGAWRKAFLKGSASLNIEDIKEDNVS